MTIMNVRFALLALCLASLLESSCSFSAVPAAQSARGAATSSSVTCLQRRHARFWTTTLCMSTEEESSETPSVEKNMEPPKPDVKCPGCNMCDGSGRIGGGIGAVLDWWPIKAYRPCPNFIERGGFYQRSGQGLDEIAFGRDSTFDVDK